MNQTRHTIFTQIRKSLGHHRLKPNVIKTLEDRLATPPIHEQPQLESDLISQFLKQLKKVSGTYVSIPDTQSIPVAVLAFLNQHHLPQKIVLDAHLRHLPWPNQWQLAYRAAKAEDKVSVTQAFAAVAETGSLVLLSSPATPTTLNFLPDNHIVVLYQDHLVAHIEAVWARLREQKQPLPRAVNFITGPSRTADIEQTLQLGAHGPRRLHVIFIEKHII